jgi:hypothetical protein
LRRCSCRRSWTYRRTATARCASGSAIRHQPTSSGALSCSSVGSRARPTPSRARTPQATPTPSIVKSRFTGRVSDSSDSAAILQEHSYFLLFVLHFVRDPSVTGRTRPGTSAPNGSRVQPRRATVARTVPPLAGWADCPALLPAPRVKKVRAAREPGQRGQQCGGRGQQCGESVDHALPPRPPASVILPQPTLTSFHTACTCPAAEGSDSQQIRDPRPRWRE